MTETHQTRPPRLLWVGKAARNHGHTGDEVFDARTIAALRKHCIVDLFHPRPVSRLQEVTKLALGIPYLRARFATVQNLRDARQASHGYEGVICSWEGMDVLARHLTPPTLFIPHNITSQMLPQIYPGPLARLAAWRARRWEQCWYRKRTFAAIAALSRADMAYLSTITDRPCVVWTPPGMPPRAPLAENAVLLPELVLLGSYGWPPKRRDVLRFAADYAGHAGSRPPIRAADEGAPNGLPPGALAALHPLPLPTPDEQQTAIRFGLITDRFQAGHKLKTLVYIAQNQIVLSFGNIAFDFSHIPDHDLFIRRVHSMEDLIAQIAQVSAMPIGELRSRFIRFQAVCASEFTWDAVAETLLGALRLKVSMPERVPSLPPSDAQQISTFV